MKQLIGMSGIALICSTTVSAVETPQKMNVILILADDVGFECIHAYGSTYHTPNIDRMAQKGMLFKNCHAQPLSTPSRVQLMTGKYNHRNYTRFAYLDPKEKTFAHLAKEAGYSTCIAGKWQLGYDSRLPEVFGFDSSCLWQLSQEREQGERYANPLYELEGNIIPQDADLYGPDIFVNHIINFIRENKRKPFFAYYPMVLCHDPFFPTPDSEEWNVPYLREKANTKHFAEMVTYMDNNVGKILDFLDEENLTEETLVIFTGDNGTNTEIVTKMQDGTTIKGGKKSTKSSGTHVPLIVCGPKVGKGKVNENLVDFSDFYPTLKDVFGIPENRKDILDGISFYKQLSDDQSIVRTWSFCHYQDQMKPDYVRFVQTIDYKLYLDGRFYNKKKDINETLNILNGTSEEESVRRELQTILVQYPVWGKEILTATSKQ
ncbi:MAG: sulfatase-like hydrolase/transferase [Tannerellaceae bacterium]|jgi:arylsulfatase A|nr:sulfatase-like hydrolase/transferase [Tannerellaceae bacterium]